MFFLEAKFWKVEDLWQFLYRIGMGEKWIDLITFALVCLVLLGLAALLYRIAQHFIHTFVRTQTHRHGWKLGAILIEKKVLRRSIRLLPLVVILSLDDLFFQGFDPKVVTTFGLIMQSLLTYYCLMVTYSLLDAWLELLLSRPSAQNRSIKGYFQVTKIVLALAAGIIIISILIQKSPATLLVGLGATAAIITLVFKDTILGFVASIQLSAQDMVRLGDWIEMPCKNADGVVLDINVNSVKVQNWNNTITMIPIYSMVSESFTNWRGMEESKGRRFVRYFYIDNRSISLADEELLQKLEQHPLTADSFKQSYELCVKYSPAGAAAVSNMSLFRAYFELFLKAHPQVNETLPAYVRYIENKDSGLGLGLEIYAFTYLKDAALYDTVHRGVMEHLLATLPLFGLKTFQLQNQS